MGRAISSKLTDIGIRFFSNIVEIFLWGFLAQDVVSMWMPRIRQSLVRGAIEYDPTTDETNKYLTPWQLFKKTWTKRVKGWNWVNFNEETKREVATGPGVLAIPTLMYSISRRMYGGTAIELGRESLTQLTDTFKELLKKPEFAHLEQASEEKMKEIVKQFFRDRFAFGPEDLNILMDVPEKVIGTAQDLNIRPEVYNLLTDKGKLVTKTQSKSLGAFLDEWVGKWVDETFKNRTAGGREKKHIAKTLAGLKDQIYKVLVDDFNVTHRQREQFLNIDHVNIDLIEESRNLDKTGVIKESKARLRSLESFLGQMERWIEIPFKVLKDQGKTTGLKLWERTEIIFKKLIGWKAILAVIASLLSGLYLYRLALWAQSHDNYEANRLLKEDLYLKKDPKDASQINQTSGKKKPSKQSEEPVLTLNDLDPAFLENLLGQSLKSPTPKPAWMIEQSPPVPPAAPVSYPYMPSPISNHTAHPMYDLRPNYFAYSSPLPQHAMPYDTSLYYTAPYVQPPSPWFRGRVKSS